MLVLSGLSRRSWPLPFILDPSVLVLAGAGCAAFVDVVIFPDQNLAILCVIPLLLAALRSPPPVVVMVAAVAILDQTVNLARHAFLPNVTCVFAVAFIAIAVMAVLLARQRVAISSLYRAARRDAGERERVNALLAESEQRFRLLADAAPALVWVAGTDQGCTYFNRAWLEFTGRSLEQELGAGWLEGVHPNDAASVMADYVAAFDARRQFVLEYRLRRHDGDYRWVLDRGAPSYDPDGAFAGYVGAALDVTELKQAEMTRGQLAALVEATDDAVFSVGLDQVVLSWNRGAERVFGYRADEIVGSPVATLCPPQRVGEVQLLVALLERDGRVERFQTVRARKDGAEVPVSLTLSPVRDPSGRVTCIAATARDVSNEVAAYQRLEQQVVERTHELATLLESSHAISSTLDLEALLSVILEQLQINVACTNSRVFSREEDELVSVEYRGPLPREEALAFSIPLDLPRVREYLLDRRRPYVVDDVSALSEPGQRALRSVEARPGGSAERIRAWMWVPLIASGEVIGGLSLGDTTPGYFTARRQALAEAFAVHAATALGNARLYEQAQRLAVIQERQRLARDLHDAVTQTLFATSLIAEVLPRLWEREPEEAQRHLNELRVLTRGAMAEMRTLLFELRPEGLNGVALPVLLSQLADATASRGQVPVSFSADEAPALPAEVRDTFYRVAQEALNNVVRHAHASRVSVRLEREDDEVELVVRDDGRGFDAECPPDGHLGLQIMRERAASIGASLAIESRIGQGTQISVSWPLPAAGAPT